MALQENTFMEKEYIREEYTRMGILPKPAVEPAVDYNIYPDDGGYIPVCSVCLHTYKTAMQSYKNKSEDDCSNLIVDSKHIRCGCLWWRYFKEKIEQKIPRVVIRGGNTVSAAAAVDKTKCEWAYKEGVRVGKLLVAREKRAREKGKN